MEKDSLSLIKLAGITILIFILTGFSIAVSPNDLRVDDIYFIINSFVKVILVILLTALFSSLVASILTKFKNRIYIKAFFFSAFLIFCFGIYIFSLFYVKH